MTFAEFMAHLDSFGFGFLLAAGIFFFTKVFSSSYLTEKGKNLATKEDIAKITDEMERIRSDYAVVLEGVKLKNQLRMAALDRRLQAHQEAFTLWRELYASVHKSDIGDVVLRCLAWWEENCLYLAANVRDSFTKACMCAKDHRYYMTNNVDSALIHRNYEQIMQAGMDIVAAVELPGLTDLEKSDLKGKLDPPK